MFQKFQIYVKFGSLETKAKQTKKIGNFFIGKNQNSLI
jgi:hypothetical protein